MVDRRVKIVGWIETGRRLVDWEDDKSYRSVEMDDGLEIL